jgi:hypothetical protein
MDGVLLFVVWAVFAIVVGIGAKAKGRSGFGWFLLALLISPLVAGLIILGSSNLAEEEVAEQVRGNSKTCPRCAESVKLAANVCRYCNYEFAGATQTLSAFGNPETAVAELRRRGYKVTFDGISGNYWLTSLTGDKECVGKAPQFTAWAAQRVAADDAGSSNRVATKTLDYTPDWI